mmetsp:Transcript_47255/g.156643  ORF Transcript_47255/g.156643 Transcript_47255/m.156643 type:complete len:316 (-) Transcript_47255:181-1128(-)
MRCTRCGRGRDLSRTKPCASPCPRSRPILAEITMRAAAPPIPCGRLRAAKAAPCVSGPCRAARRCSRCRTRIGPRLLSLFALLIWTVGGSQLPLNAQVMALAIERALPPLSGALGGREGVYLLSGSFDGRCTLWRSDLEDDRSPTGFAKLHSFAVATVPGASSGGEGDGVLSLLLSASRDLVVAGRNSGAIHLYALSKLDAAPFATGVQSTDGGACALSWYGDAGRAFLAGSEDGVCKSWELAEPGTRRRNQPPGALVCLGVAQVGEEVGEEKGEEKGEVLAIACTAASGICGLADGRVVEVAVPQHGSVRQYTP